MSIKFNFTPELHLVDADGMSEYRDVSAYECPPCGYVTSVLIAPKDGEAGSGPRHELDARPDVRAHQKGFTGCLT